VWQELARGLMEVQPSRMLHVLREAGALARLLPEVEALYGVPQRAEYHPEIDTGLHVEMVLDQAARLDAPLTVRFACLTHDLGKAATPAHVLPRHLGHEGRSVQLLQPLVERLKVPRDCRALAELCAREHGNVHQSGGFGPQAVVRLLRRCDAWRAPERFAELLLACECDARGRLGLADRDYPQRTRLQQAQAITAAVDQGAIVATLRAQRASPPAGDVIAAAIDQARVAALAAAWGESPASDDAPKAG